MKKLILTTIVLAFALTTALAQKPAQIKFEKTTHDFGSFSETNPKVNSRWLSIRPLLRAAVPFLSIQRNL